jgi:Rieske Fe-S protein
MIVRDIVLGRDNPYRSLYEATRVKPIAALPTFLEENIDFPIHLVTDRVARPDAASVADVRPGQGAIVRVRGERLAVYRDPRGAVHAMSGVCTHLGCIVKFNEAEKTWDCPCHGSRFSLDGSVIDGPATRALAPRVLEPERRESGFHRPGLDSDHDHERKEAE